MLSNGAFNPVYSPNFKQRMMTTATDCVVSEALLLAETEALFDALDPTAFALALPCADAAPSRPSGSISLPAKPRGRRCWKANALRNPSRERLRSELATLRQQAVELESELTLARRHRVELESRQLLLLPVWERISRRQRDARDTAEGERRRLRAAVEDQRVFVAQLLHAWHRWQRMTALDPFASLASASVRFEATDAALFDMLAATIDLEYVRMRDVFQDAGLLQRAFDVSSRQVAKTRMLDSGEAVPFLELGVVEHDVHELGVLNQAVRQCMLRRSAKLNVIVYEDVPIPERTRAVKVRFRAMRGGKEVFLEELFVTRRYYERNQMITVWRGVTKEANGSEFPDTFVEETGWIAMKSMAGMDGAPFPNGTLTLTCVHMEPKQQHKLVGGGGVGDVSDPFAELVMDSFQSDFDELNAMIDELLLESPAPDSPSSTTSSASSP